MRAFVLYILLAILALSVQALLFPGIVPDLVLVLVCLYTLKYGHTKGIAYGAVAGLLIDSASGVILGPHILSKTLASLFMRLIREKLFYWNIIINTISIIAISIVDILVVYACLSIFADIPFSNRPWNISFMQVIYTSIAGFLMYPVLNPERG